jgi:hypothetical protein
LVLSCFFMVLTYNLDGLHHRVRPDVACEEANPQEGGLLCEVWELRFDVVGGLVFALLQWLVCRKSIISLRTTNTHIHMRHVFATQLLARGKRMQDKVLETRDLVRRSGNVDELLGLLLRGGHCSEL